ncbi:MAG TPA: hypothetical protein DCQ04_05540 [Actinobacteria bacterium]|nr:hypothetical protein [Actinomycetota bacterium]
MKTPLLIGIGFLVMAALATAITVRGLRKKNLSSSGMLITPEKDRTRYGVEVGVRLIGCGAFYAAAAFAFWKAFHDAP